RARERVFKGGLAARSPVEKREHVHSCRPRGLSVAEGCRLMGLVRSTYYDEPKSQPVGEARLVQQNKENCAEWPAFRYRRGSARVDGEGRLGHHQEGNRLVKQDEPELWPAPRVNATT